MLRLDPSHPPLWRTPTALQFGADGVAHVRHPTPWQERLVRELESGMAEDDLDAIALEFGAPPGAGAQFVRRIARALKPRTALDHRAVIVQAPAGAASETSIAVAWALAEAGFEVTDDAVPAAPEPGGVPVILLAHYLVEPHRAAALMQRDAPHLPIVFSGERVDIGPFVRPGASACLACIAAHRRDADRAWPLLSAQLIGRAAPHVPRALALEAGLVAAALLGDPSGSASRVLTVRSGSLRRSIRRYAPHEDCRCRSLAGSGIATVDAAPPPTTATGCERPA